MADRQLPEPELLRKLIRYDPATGKMYWLERTPEMFGPSSRFLPEVLARQWNSRHVGHEALCGPHGDGYLDGSVLGVSVYAHRAAWCVHYGYWPEAQIDHINGCRDDNRLGNLRCVSRSDNLKNAKKTSANSSGVMGVSRHSRRGWVANIGHNNRKIYLGLFSSFEEAVEARKSAEKEYGFHPNHGDRS